MPITLVLLVLVFGGLLAASLPLFVGVLAVLGTFLSLYVLGSLTDVSIYAINLTTALGPRPGHRLQPVHRLPLPGGATQGSHRRAGRRPHRSRRPARRSRSAPSPSPCRSSALLVFPQYFLRSFAYAGIAVVLLAMVASDRRAAGVAGRDRTSHRLAARVPAPRHQARGGRLLVPHGHPRHAAAGPGGPRRRRRAPAARRPVPACPVRHARRPGAARVRCRPRRSPRSCGDDFEGDTSESFPVVVDQVDGDVGAALVDVRRRPSPTSTGSPASRRPAGRSPPASSSRRPVRVGAVR